MPKETEGKVTVTEITEGLDAIEEAASYFEGLATECDYTAAEHDAADNQSTREWHRGQADAYRDAAEKLRTDAEWRDPGTISKGSRCELCRGAEMVPARGPSGESWERPCPNCKPSSPPPGTVGKEERRLLDIARCCIDLAKDRLPPHISESDHAKAFLLVNELGQRDSRLTKEEVRGQVKEWLDGLSAVANDHYHGGEEERVQQVNDEIGHIEAAADAAFTEDQPPEGGY